MSGPRADPSERVVRRRVSLVRFACDFFFLHRFSRLLMNHRVRLLGSILVASTISCSHGGSESGFDAGVAASQSVTDGGPQRAATVQASNPAIAARIAAIEGLHQRVKKAIEPRANGLEIDGARFVSDAFRKGSAADPSHLGAVFPARADEALRFSPTRVESWSLRLAPVGARASEGASDRGRVFWADAYPSTDLVAVSGERPAE